MSEVCSANQKNKSNVRKRRWTLREKKTILSILQDHGDTDIQKFIDALPSKSRFQITAFLNRNRKIAKMKLKKKHYSSQNELQKVHQWLPLINVINNGAEATLHKNLPALILPIISKYSQHPVAQKFGNVDFRMAYTFLFNTLTNTPTPNTICADETVAALLACTSQLMEEIRNKTDVGNELFEELVYKSIKETDRESSTNASDGDVFSMPEINSFKWTKEEIEQFCTAKL